MISKTEIFRIQFSFGSMVGPAAPLSSELSRKTDHYSLMLTDITFTKITSIAGLKEQICCILSNQLVLAFLWVRAHKISIIVTTLNP
jgi:hypothetical protein